MYVNSKQSNPSFFNQNPQSILKIVILVNFNPHKLFDTSILILIFYETKFCSSSFKFDRTPFCSLIARSDVTTFCSATSWSNVITFCLTIA